MMSISESFMQQCLQLERRKHPNTPELQLRNKITQKLYSNPSAYQVMLDMDAVNSDVKASTRKAFEAQVPEAWREAFALERALHGNDWTDREVLNLVAMHINSNFNYYKTYLSDQMKQKDDRKADLVDTLTRMGKVPTCETCTCLQRHMGGNPHRGTCDLTRKQTYMSKSCQSYLPDSTKIYSLR